MAHEPFGDEWFQDEPTSPDGPIALDLAELPLAAAAAALNPHSWGVVNYKPPDGAWVEVPLVEDTVVIGRSGRCPVCLASDTSVSRVHCTLEKTKTGARLVDQSSSGGTWLDGQRIDKVQLLGGETVRVGNTALVFRPISKPVDFTMVTNLPPGEAVEELVSEIGAEGEAPNGAQLRQDPLVIPILKGPREARATAAVACARLLGGARAMGPSLWGTLSEAQEDTVRRLLSLLLRAKIPFDDEQLATLATAATATPSPQHFPLSGVLTALERHLGDSPAQGDLAGALGSLKSWLSRFDDREGRRLHKRVSDLLVMGRNDAVPVHFDSWGLALKRFVDGQVEHAWIDFLQQCHALHGELQPSATWTHRTLEVVRDLDRDVLAEAMGDWLRAFHPGPGMHPDNADLVLGIVRISGLACGHRIAEPLVDWCQRCFATTEEGQAAPRLGRAGLLALSDLQVRYRRRALKKLEASLDNGPAKLAKTTLG